jgi:hypothetical protein
MPLSSCVKTYISKELQGITPRIGQWEPNETIIAAGRCPQVFGRSSVDFTRSWEVYLPYFDTKIWFIIWKKDFKVWTLHVLSRILVTRQVTNGFRSTWIDLLDIHQAELQLVVTQSYCNYNTSQLRTMITPHKLKASPLTSSDFLVCSLLDSALLCSTLLSWLRVLRHDRLSACHSVLE